MKFRVANIFKGRWKWTFLIFLCIVVMMFINHRKLRQWTSQLIQKTSQLEGMDPNTNYSYIPDDGNLSVRATFGVNDYLNESVSLLAFYKWRMAITKPLPIPTQGKTPYTSVLSPGPSTDLKTGVREKFLGPGPAPGYARPPAAPLKKFTSADIANDNINDTVKEKAKSEVSGFVGSMTEGMTLNTRTGDYRGDITKSKLYSMYNDYNTNVSTQLSAIYDPIFKPAKSSTQAGLLAPLLRDFDKIYSGTTYFFLANPQNASSRVYQPNLITNYFTGLLQKYGNSASNLSTVESGLIHIMSQLYVFNQLYVDYINNPRQFFSPDDTCFLINVAMDTIESIDLSKLSKQGNGTVYMLSSDNDDYTNTALNYDMLRIAMANFVLSKMYNVSLSNPDYTMSIDKFLTDYPIFIANNKQLQGIHGFMAKHPPVFPTIV